MRGRGLYTPGFTTLLLKVESGVLKVSKNFWGCVVGHSRNVDQNHTLYLHHVLYAREILLCFAKLFKPKQYYENANGNAIDIAPVQDITILGVCYKFII